ncbi:hypothetical protein IWX49DRAFT_580622 [Phyllosticta citricarpa]
MFIGTLTIFTSSCILSQLLWGARPFLRETSIIFILENWRRWRGLFTWLGRRGRSIVVRHQFVGQSIACRSHIPTTRRRRGHIGNSPHAGAMFSLRHCAAQLLIFVARCTTKCGAQQNGRCDDHRRARKFVGFRARDDQYHSRTWLVPQSLSSVVQQGVPTRRQCRLSAGAPPMSCQLCPTTITTCR